MFAVVQKLLKGNMEGKWPIKYISGLMKFERQILLKCLCNFTLADAIPYQTTEKGNMPWIWYNHIV